ncbi:MAG TPA: LytTR family DNA-binding domain-containing protein [Chitinophaga sp.]|uniref:LytR/AlgR family response regulator transcription factor n=1 Tax=Chitinophaga sp. TaxID=1869181 RepID=UPI002DBBAED3|nr:LytTR family DNA-binding domain-containing protein [Chitinophaga sp.]HEU4551513.1 LytTR family DNA-binding domain-containing protein [Chitinophaga sp.]
MKKISCIIVDDEPVARKILHEFIDQVPFLDLQGKFENAVKAEAFLSANIIDLIFLDIEMPKVSGLQFLQQLQAPPMAILTTAFPKYALEGYELDIIDYLLKPFAFNRFLKGVQKARDFHQLKFKTTTIPDSYIFIKSDKRIEKIELKDILYAESVGNYVSIYTENKRIITYLTMKSLEAQLPAGDFIKIHQSYLINGAKIEAIEGNEIKISSKSLPISRNYREAVMKVIQQRLLKR